MKLPDLQRLTHNCLNRMSQSDQPTWSQDKALHRGIVKPFVQMSTAGYSSGVGHMHVRCATGKSLPPVSHLSELLLEGVLMGLGIEIPQIAAVLKVPNQDTSDGIGVGSSDERHRGHAEQRPYNGDHLTDPCDSHEGHGVDGITSQRTDEPLPTLGRKRDIVQISQFVQHADLYGGDEQSVQQRHRQQAAAGSQQERVLQNDPRPDQPRRFQLLGRFHQGSPANGERRVRNLFQLRFWRWIG